MAVATGLAALVVVVVVVAVVVVVVVVAAVVVVVSSTYLKCDLRVMYEVHTMHSGLWFVE